MATAMIAVTAGDFYMQRTLIAIVLATSTSAAFGAQAQPAPQTARQALIEMFFGKTPGSLEKHLPEATKAALRQAGGASGMSPLAAFSLIGSQISANGQQLQTFEAGPTLLVAENPRVHSKVEITVENDDLRADEDEIELSFKGYKDGQEQIRGVMPRLKMLMKQEAGIWRLNTITFSISVPLADPEFLKGLMQSAARTHDTAQISRAPVNSAAVVGALRTILTAEMTYSRTYTAQGYTCSLSDLDGFGGGEPNERQAMLIESRLASGKKYGYVFRLSGCSGPPSSKFRLSAAPSGASGGQAFCANESGLIRSSEDGSVANCWAAGKPMQ
jgi:hypothetical protein